MPLEEGMKETIAGGSSKRAGETALICAGGPAGVRVGRGGLVAAQAREHGYAGVALMGLKYSTVVEDVRAWWGTLGV